MKFSEVLPHLAAGRKVRRAVWKSYGGWVHIVDKTMLDESGEPCLNATGYAGNLLATDWELVEEPTVREYAFCPRHQFAQSAYPCLCDSADKKALADQASTIARLTRELEEARLDAANYRRVTLADLDAVVRKARP